MRSKPYKWIYHDDLSPQKAKEADAELRQIFKAAGSSAKKPPRELSQKKALSARAQAECRLLEVINRVSADDDILATTTVLNGKWASPAPWDPSIKRLVRRRLSSASRSVGAKAILGMIEVDWCPTRKAWQHSFHGVVILEPRQPISKFASAWRNALNVSPDAYVKRPVKTKEASDILGWLRYITKQFVVTAIVSRSSYTKTDGKLGSRKQALPKVAKASLFEGLSRVAPDDQVLILEPDRHTKSVRNDQGPKVFQDIASNTALDDRSALATSDLTCARVQVCEGQVIAPTISTLSPLVGLKLHRIVKDEGGKVLGLVVAASTAEKPSVLVELSSKEAQSPHLTAERLFQVGIIATAAEVKAAFETKAASAPELIRPRRPGWQMRGSAPAFVSLTHVIGPGASDYALDSTIEMDRTKSAYQRWAGSVGRHLQCSSAGVTLLAAAHAAPLLAFLDSPETFFLLLAGPTSTGKSTIMRAVLSFQGEREEFPSHSTSRGLEEAAEAHNHHLFAVSDLSQVTAGLRQRMLELTYNVTAPIARRRAASVQVTVPNAAFQVIGAGTAEEPSWSGGARKGGETVRCFDLTIGRPSVGFFDRIFLSRDFRAAAARQAELLARATARFDDVPPLLAWVGWLALQEPEHLRDEVGRLRETFVSEVTAADTPTPIRRAAKQFGLLYAALVLANRADLLPWEEDRICRAAVQAFSRWVSTVPSAKGPPSAVLNRLVHAAGSDVASVKRNTLETPPDGFFAVREADGQRRLGLIESRVVEVFGGEGKRALQELDAKGRLAPSRRSQRWLVRFGERRLTSRELLPEVG